MASVQPNRRVASVTTVEKHPAADILACYGGQKGKIRGTGCVGDGDGGDVHGEGEGTAGDGS